MLEDILIKYTTKSGLNISISGEKLADFLVIDVFVQKKIGERKYMPSKRFFELIKKDGFSTEGFEEEIITPIYDTVYRQAALLVCGSGYNELKVGKYADEAYCDDGKQIEEPHTSINFNKSDEFIEVVVGEYIRTRIPINH